MQRLRKVVRNAQLLGSALAVMGTMATAQQDMARCAIEIPVNVIVPDGRLIRELKADQLVARTKHDPLRVLAAVDDTGPRRVLFVLETGHSVLAKIGVVEFGVITEILSEARPEDSFALLTARGPRKAVPFGQSRDVIVAAVKSLGSTGDNKHHDDGVLDALLEGAEWFHEPKPGDAIFLMTIGFESEHRASYSRVVKELADRQIRVFSFLFAPLMVGTYSNGIVKFTGGRPDFLTNDTFFMNKEDVASFSWGTGGYVVQENFGGDSQHEDQITDQKMESLKTAASRMYSATTEYYRITLDASPREFTLSLAEDIRKKVPNAVAIYTRHLPACATK